MPAILGRERNDAWLSGFIKDAKDTLKPYPEEFMVAYPITIRINSPKNNGAT